MKKLMLLLTLICAISFSFVSDIFAQPKANKMVAIANAPIKAKKTKAKIQVALLLDTSSSMDGLIEQAKSQLWKMVNELATAQKGAHAPEIEIALYHYGNSGLSGQAGYVQQIVPLSADLDLVSEKLFELRTNGGDEYCGWVIQDATNDLAWSASHEDLKIIIIAGNEPFNQGKVDYKKSCKNAIKKGIMINTIHCGRYQEGIEGFWKEGADLADGQYMNIDQNDQVVHIPTPYDTAIIRLNQELNSTYIGYGATGIQQAERQMAQDVNAASYGAANTRTRAAFKAKESYNNAGWDLVDAAEEDTEIIEEIKEEELPKEMQGMTLEERKTYVNNKREKREEVRKKILELEEKANEYEIEERKKNSEKLTLDNVLIGAVKKQAESKSFEFK